MIEIVTLIRFSFLASDEGYRLGRGLSLDERAAELFGNERLHRRFEAFESICLPSLRMQPPDRFHVIILASAAMPDGYKERLLASVQGMVNVHIVFEEPAQMFFEELWLKHIGRIQGLKEIVATVRLDDDDALAPDFTATLAAYVNARYVGHTVSFPLGLQCAMVEGELRFWESYWPLVAAGLGYVCRRDSLATIFSCGHHHRIARRYPVILDARSAKYVVTLHQHNDSQVGMHPLLGRRARVLRYLKRAVRPPRAAETHNAQDRKAPARTWSIDEAEREAPELAPVLRGCDWSRL